MTRLAALSDRVVGLILALGVALVCMSLGGLWWRHHRAADTDARTRHTLDSLATVATAQRDSLSALRERYRADTVRVRETTVVYRAARVRVDTVLVTGHGDTVRVDTLTVVRDLSRACDATIQARDVALSTCEARVAAARRLYVADSTRGRLELLATQRAAAARSHRATRHGLLVGAALTLATVVALRAATH